MKRDDNRQRQPTYEQPLKGEGTLSMKRIECSSFRSIILMHMQYADMAILRQGELILQKHLI